MLSAVIVGLFCDPIRSKKTKVETNSLEPRVAGPKFFTVPVFGG